MEFSGCGREKSAGGKQGKPYFFRWPEIYFNLSHCRSACACILSDREAGIDVEHRFPYKESLARRVCHEKEWELMRQSCSGRRRKGMASAGSVVLEGELHEI